MKLISKDAILAEINQRIEDYKSHKIDDSYHDGLIFALEDLRDDFINTLEVKEVELEQEVRDFCYKFDDRKDKWYNMTPHDQNLMVSPTFANFAMQLAKHFFELGVNTSNPLTWEDMMLIHKCIKDAMNYHLYKMMEGIEGQKVVYEEVLKRFKAQKGE